MGRIITPAGPLVQVVNNGRNIDPGRIRLIQGDNKPKPKDVRAAVVERDGKVALVFSSDVREVRFNGNAAIDLGRKLKRMGKAVNTGKKLKVKSQKRGKP